MLYEYYLNFFTQLAKEGIQDIVLSPGGRSAPLAICADSIKNFNIWVHQDERSAGFFALGLAKAGLRPVGLICTSGTAAANYTPAIAEAFNAGVPLIVMTADRPPELRGWGSEQTIHQPGLYGQHLRWFVELPLADESLPQNHAQLTAQRALAMTKGPPFGPVHINCPIREPLEPNIQIASQNIDVNKFKPEAPAYLNLEKEAARLADLAQKYDKGLILTGPQDLLPEECDALYEFSSLAGWPIISDGSTPLRFHPYSTKNTVLSSGHWLAQSGYLNQNTPDVVLRMGSSPTNRSLSRSLQKLVPEYVVLCDPDNRWEEASFTFNMHLNAPLRTLFQTASKLLQSQVPSDWVKQWAGSDEQIQQIISEELDAALTDGCLLEPEIAKCISAETPPDSILFLGNSLPIRDFDAFAATRPQSLRILTNRGANGIDGLIASALGAAAGSKSQVILVIGDLAALCDIGSLLSAARLGIPLKLIIVNNSGGGIFESLPLYENLDNSIFERLFLTPSGLDSFEFLSHFPGVTYSRAASYGDLADFLKESPGQISISEIQAPREQSRQLRSSILNQVKASLGL